MKVATPSSGSRHPQVLRKESGALVEDCNLGGTLSFFTCIKLGHRIKLLTNAKSKGGSIDVTLILKGVTSIEQQLPGQSLTTSTGQTTKHVFFPTHDSKGSRFRTT